MTNRKLVHFRQRKVRVKCECGEEISIFPDVKATSEAIEVHIALHTKGAKGPACTTVEAERLRDALIVQALRIAGEFEDEETNE